MLCSGGREGGREGGVNVPHLIASFRMRQTLWVIARHLVLSEALVGMNKLDLSFGERNRYPGIELRTFLY